MSVNKIVIGTTVGLLLLVALIYVLAEKEIEESSTGTSDVRIENTWELPGVLSEISGIAFLEDHKVLGVQDELGKLFVYNLNTKVIEKEIEFGGSGDYEGVAVKGADAFVLQSDGSIIEVENYLSSPQVSTHDNWLNSEADTEGICLDEKNNRLLISVKEAEPGGEDFKGIYAVSLNTMEMQKEPVFKINLKDSVFKDFKEEDLKDTFKPSEINIHPGTGDVYVLGGTKARLLILDPQGTPKQLYILDKTDFPQPEGLTFDASENLYISNEGSPGTIHRVILN